MASRPKLKQDEGLKRRAQQRRIIANFLTKAAPDDTQHDPVVPRGQPSRKSLPNADIAEAVFEVLLEVGAAMSPHDISEWLAESAVQAAPEDVIRALEGPLKSRVKDIAQGKWEVAAVQLDADQRVVAFAPAPERVLVIAGPGAGKTEVACARVVHALGAGVSSRAILVISFTRAATAEIRERIGRLSGPDSDAARQVEVRTLDSLAWMLQRHLLDADLLTGSYGDNIERTLELVVDPPAELREYLDSIRLLVLDETQDIVGRRSDLALALIGALRSTAGVTVFADPAQAIYGDWALDEGMREGDADPLSTRIERGEAGDFVVRTLSGMHRTDNATLTGIANDLRVFALVRDMTSTAAYAGLRDALEERAGVGARSYSGLVPMVRQDTTQFFLFRTHGEVVQLSSYMSGESIAHRLRFPGLPKVVYPWIGRLLYLGATRKLRRPEFDRHWDERVLQSAFNSVSQDEGWAVLTAVAGDGDLGYVDTLYLREILSRRNPPDEVCAPAVGQRGPVLSTIHGSKGREARDVVLGLTNVHGESELGEEARVLYVGATRARDRLRVASIGGAPYYLASRRAWRFASHRTGSAAQLEFGLEGDVDSLSPVALILGNDADNVDRQEFFASLDIPAAGVSWKTEAVSGWRRILRLQGYGQPIGACDKRYDNDLWEVANRFKKPNLRPPNAQSHLHLVDFTTVARDNDSADLNQLTRTFAGSGFWVAPVIKGYSLVFPQWGRAR